MSKKIKRVIAMTLVLSAFLANTPNNKYFELLVTKAYASSDDYGIENLEIEKGNSSADDNDDDSLTMYTDSNYGDSTSFERSEYDYYVKTTGSSIRIKVNRVSGYIYKIFKSGSSKVYSSADDLDLKEGNNTFYVRTYEKDGFNEDNVEKNQVRCYEIHVQRKNSSNAYLKSISLDEGSISFSKNTLSYNVEVDSDIDNIKITAKPEDDNNVVIDDTKVEDQDNYRKEVSLNKGKNTIKIEVGDESDNTKTYTLNIYRGTKVAASNATVEYGPKDYSQPDAYLESLGLNNGDIKFDFDKKISIYNVKIDATVDKMDVVARPDDSDYKVEINGKKLTSDKDYEAVLSNLELGKNTFSIKVTNNENKSRIYTLNIYRGTSVAVTTTTSANTSTTQAVKANQWVQTSGRWQYNDKDGNPYKNKLFYDQKYKNTYYVDGDGFMVTGIWQLFEGKTYYADNSGAIQKGWLKLGPNWYHLNSESGAMDTGWYQDGGKWYYSESTGIMAHDTYIGKFKLGSSGAWIN